MMAARITRIQAFTALTQVRVMPLFFLPGALYPLRARPAWPTVLTRFDPITYVVCCVVWPMRHAVCSHLNIAPAAGAALFPPLARPCSCRSHGVTGRFLRVSHSAAPR
jgi:ABC-2 type transport system permease protein